MNIFASAPVPAENRLIDADTADLTAIRRPLPSGDDRYAEGYADGLNRAVTARKADNAGRFPTNQPYTGRAAVPAAPSAEVLELGRKVEELVNTTDMRPAEIAAELGVSVAEAFNAHVDRICWQEGAGRLVGKASPSGESDRALVELAASANPDGVRQLANAIRSGCPVWCTEDHRGQVTDVDGFAIGLVHERVMAEQVGQDPTWHREHAATATVLVESTTGGGEVVTEPRILLSVAEGAEGGYPGSEGVQGWTGTPEQARALAAALLAAAELVEHTAR